MIMYFNPPKAEEPVRNTVDNRVLMSSRLINSPALGATMYIPIDIPLLCGGVVHAGWLHRWERKDFFIRMNLVLKAYRFSLTKKFESDKRF
jgi:hypothetical protein